MKDVTIIMALVLAAWAFMSCSSTAAALDIERLRASRAEFQATTLATQVAYWKPTPMPCHSPYYGGNWC